MQLNATVADGLSSASVTVSDKSAGIFFAFVGLGIFFAGLGMIPPKPSK